jgi:hypothetical protein
MYQAMSDDIEELANGLFHLVSERIEKRYLAEGSLRERAASDSLEAFPSAVQSGRAGIP